MHWDYYRFGIINEYVYRSINDTATSAKKTGLNISQGRQPKITGTTCQMHTQELVVKHALGLNHRSKNKVKYDENIEGLKLRDRVKALVSQLMNKRKKSIFLKYKNYCKVELGSEALRLEIPNDTRVSGVFRMYESILRAKTSLNAFCKNSEDHQDQFVGLLLTNEEWQDVAETHAILKLFNVVALTSQQESVDSNCLSYLQIQIARFYISCEETFSVINIQKQWKPNLDIDLIPMNTLGKHQLSSNSINLINKLKYELRHYFKQPDSDVLMMMVYHPIMVKGGIK